MTAEEYLRAGQLDQAMGALREAIKKATADAKLRIFLFQLLCVGGQWDKALTQLQVLGDMDADSMLMAQIYTPVLHCEALRADVFSGKRSPLIFGDPEEWISLLVQANVLIAAGNFEASRELRERAFEAAPAVAGKVNNDPFEWIADADSRLGPMLEVIMEGKYYWIPFSRIQKLQLEPPTDLRNFVWTAAQFVWTNGGNAPGFIPTRYAGSEAASDTAVRLAKRTDWDQKADGLYVGLGQRVFATDAGEYPLLELRNIEFAAAPAVA
jgi:type VI secretion system protein ImpE